MNEENTQKQVQNYMHFEYIEMNTFFEGQHNVCPLLVMTKTVYYSANQKFVRKYFGSYYS